MKLSSKFNKSDYWDSVVRPVLHAEFLNKVELYALISQFPHIEYEGAAIPDYFQIDKIIYLLAKNMVSSIFGRRHPKFDAGLKCDHIGTPMIHFQVSDESVDIYSERYLRNIVRKILDSRLTIH